TKCSAEAPGQGFDRRGMGKSMVAVNSSGQRETSAQPSSLPLTHSTPTLSASDPEFAGNSGSGETVHVLARRGMRHLFVRQIFTTAVTMAGGVVLARVLSSAEFGTYSIATFIVNIFMIFGDLGLGPSFIQSKTAPSHKDLQTSFTL